MSADPWDPRCYARFAAERSQPFSELLSLVVRAPGMRIVDLGCGDGALTARLHRALGARDTLGIDSSDAMLAQSAAHAAPGLRFLRADIGSWQPEGLLDLVFSNAALHWVGDHPALFQRIAGWLAPAGQLAVQVPANHDDVSQRVLLEVAASAPFAAALGGWVHRSPVMDEPAYAQRLHRLGCVEQHVGSRVYLHELASREAVVEWMAGTTLTAYRRRLPAALAADFERAYAERLLAQLPDARPFPFFFRRLLIWGRRGG